MILLLKNKFYLKFSHSHDSVLLVQPLLVLLINADLMTNYKLKKSHA